VRAFVTGAGGFVGGWLCRHLKASGDEVCVLDASVDVTDQEALTEALCRATPHAVYHLAALSSVSASWEDQQTTYRVNTMGTLNVCLAAATCSPPPRVLLVSSSEVYGRARPDRLPLREDQPLAPVSPYAASKAAAEMIGLQWWLGRGLEVVRARPFNHSGPGQRADFVVPSLASQVAEAARQGGGKLLVGNLEAKRDLTDVRDVVRAYRLLALKGTPGEAYNVCRGQSVQISEVLEELVRICGARLEVEVDPARFRPAEIPDISGDPTRLKEATGWEPEIDLSTTLADVLQFWLGQPPS
jgi:GDP-4-dehydro-6-deoxy-D-mannose reductase